MTGRDHTVLTGGRGLVESPRWHGGRLWFADWISGEIVALDPRDGSCETVVRHPSLPLCFDFLPDGTLVLVSGPRNALLRADDDGALHEYADLSPVAAGFNDIVVDRHGNAYVNAPGYDPRAGGPPAGPRAPGLVALVRPDGSVTRVADDLAFPNGMAVTADGATLVVADSHRGQLVAFGIADDGTLGERRVWADLGPGAAPDGICLDEAGACWYADVPNAHCRRVAEGGRVLDTVPLDRGGFACMLGGSTLYVTAAHWGGMQNLDATAWDGQVVAFPAPAVGAGWPGN